MKLKSDWLETLSAAARQVPLDISDPMPRTAARVLAEVRGNEAPWWDYLALRGAVAACVVAAAVWMLRPLVAPVPEDAGGLAASMLSTHLEP